MGAWPRLVVLVTIRAGARAVGTALVMPTKIRATALPIVREVGAVFGDIPFDL